MMKIVTKEDLIQSGFKHVWAWADPVVLVNGMPMLAVSRKFEDMKEIEDSFDKECPIFIVQNDIQHGWDTTDADGVVMRYFVPQEKHLDIRQDCEP